MNQLIANVIEATKDNQRTVDVFNGDWETHFDTQSEADAFMVWVLAVFTSNRAAAITAFKESALGQREKAQRCDYIAMMFNPYYGAE